MATPTSGKNWKRDRGEAVELPSGNVALIRRPGMEKLFAAGVLPDDLTKIAMEQVSKAERGGVPQDHKKPGPSEETIDPEALAKFMEGENAVRDIFQSFDRVTEMCVLQPKVLWHMRRKVDEAGRQVMDEHDKPVYEEIPSNQRLSDEHPTDSEYYVSEDLVPVYTDEVDQDDKTFIFNFVVGGTRDLEKFRQEYGDALATVRPGEDVGVSPE